MSKKKKKKNPLKSESLPYPYDPEWGYKRLERALVLDAIKYHDGNKSAAARTLGISKRTITNMLNRWRKEGYDV